MNECALVRDLLVMYENGECSSDSREFIETHMPKCPSCRALLQEITTGNATITSREEAASIGSRKSFLRKYGYWLLFLTWAVLFVGYIVSFITARMQATGAPLSLYLNWLFGLVLITGLIVVGGVVIVKAIKWAVNLSLNRVH